MTEIKQHIIDAVKNNKLHMVPKWKVVLYSFLVGGSLVFMVFLAVFLVSFGMFLLSRYGFLFLSLRDFISILHVLHILPLLVFLLTAVLIIVIELIARRYTFFAKKPILITLGSVGLVILLIGLIISDTSLHEYVRAYAKEHKMDAMIRVYDRPLRKERAEGMVVVRGQIAGSSSSALGETVDVVQFNEEVIKIFATTTKTKNDINLFQKGDDITVLGIMKSEGVEIVKIRKTGTVTPFGRPPVYKQQDRNLKELGAPLRNNKDLDMFDR